MKSTKRYDEKPRSRWNHTDRMEYYLTVYECGKAVSAGDLSVAVNLILAVQRADKPLYEEAVKDGGFIRELAQKVLDCAIDRNKADEFFKKRKLDLYKLAHEPRNE